MGDGEAEGDALLVQRSRLLGGMRLLVLGAGLRAEDVLDVAQLEEVTGLGRVQHVVARQLERRAGGPGDGHSGAAWPVHLHVDGDGAGEHGEEARRAVRREHLLDDRYGGSGLVAQLRDPPRSGVQSRVRCCRRAKRVGAAVVVADPLAHGAVAGGDAELLDPGMLVRRDGL